jgi:DNA invertase Pin-like site-specific DNA recombinase
MANGQFISYLRVSTKEQGDSGLGLEGQRSAVTSYLNGGKWALIQEVVEVESGKRNDRPKLAEALRLCRIYNATLLVAKLDRLARNVAFISKLMEAGVSFVACDMPQANDMTIHILASVAQGEAKAISDRTIAALAAAKALGTPLGGMRSNSGSIHTSGTIESVKVRHAKAVRHAVDLIPVIDSIKAEGATSLREIAAILNERKIPTARGGEWSAVQVQRVIGQSKAAA